MLTVVAFFAGQFLYLMPTSRPVAKPTCYADTTNDKCEICVGVDGKKTRACKCDCNTCYESEDGAGWMTTAACAQPKPAWATAPLGAKKEPNH